MSHGHIFTSTVVTVSIPATVSIGEGDGMVEVCANATFPSGGSQRNVTVTLTTYDATGKWNWGSIIYLDHFLHHYSNGWLRLHRCFH